VRGRLLRKREYDLAVTQWRHCERSEAGSFSQGRRDCFTRRKDEVRNDSFFSHSEPQSSEESLRLLRKRNDELAVTKWGSFRAAKQRGISETASEAIRRPRSDHPKGKKTRLFRRRKDDLAVTRQGVAAGVSFLPPRGVFFLFHREGSSFVAARSEATKQSRISMR